MLRVKVAQPLEGDWAPVVWAVALALAIAGPAFRADAQQPPDSPPVVHMPGSRPPAAGVAAPSAAEAAEDPRARADAARLAELIGLRQKLEQNLPTEIQEAVEAMQRSYSGVDPRFVAEFEKRARARFNPDDYVAVFVRVYAAHYTAAELEEMIAAVRARQKSERVTISPELAEKIRANAVELQSELMGESTQVSARLGGEIGKEIGKEHPDWVRNLSPATPAAKN